MKICVCGLPQSGKDTFIEKIRPFGFEHLKGSATLQNLSLKKYNTDFSRLTENEKSDIRHEFITVLSAIDESKNIAVDGHYSFGNDIVFLPEDGTAYDVFVYLNVSPSVIHDRLQRSERNKKYAGFDKYEIEKWQEREITELSEICFKNKREFIVFDDDTNESLLFLKYFLKDFPHSSSYSKATKIAENIIKRCQNNKKIALFDCDKTVSANDITDFFIEFCGLSMSFLKELFRNEPYTQYQFWRLGKYIESSESHIVASEYASGKIVFNNLVVEKINDLKKDGYSVFGLTSGILAVWKVVNETEKLFIDVFGGILSKSVKGYVSEILKERGYTVFSCGDSAIDIFMLECASIGVIWAPGKIRESIQHYFDRHRETNIVQFKLNLNQYIGIKAI